MRKPLSELTALSIGALAAVSVATLGEKSSSWELVYAHDGQGNSVEGSKGDLIRVVREGRPVRIYWTGRTVEHVTDSYFLTIMGGEVFAQTPMIRAQRPSIDPPKVEFHAEGVTWNAIFATNGDRPLSWYAQTD